LRLRRALLRAANWKFLFAILAYLLIGAVLGWGILLAVKGLLASIVGFLAYVVAFGKLGACRANRHIY